jgi:phage shock protein A
MFKRFWNYLKALITGKLDQLEDPEVLLSQAQQEMRENLAKNRERAVQAITQKNRLQSMVEETEKRVNNLEAQAEMALKRNDRELALRIMREKITLDESLKSTRQAFEQSIQTSEAVKVAIRREEERVRQRLAEKLALVANWKQSQIQISIDKALSGMTLEEETSTWERATEKIKTAQSEASARAELAQASIQAKLADLQDQTVDVEAERALQDLEQRSGTVAPAVEPTVTATAGAGTAGVSEAEQALQELEARMGGGTQPAAQQPATEQPAAEQPAQPEGEQSQQ